MSRVNGSPLMFNEEEVRTTGRAYLLPRLIRIIFYGLQITNDSYLNKYWDYYQMVNPGKTRKDFSFKSAADRDGIRQKTKLTFNMMSTVIRAMGWEIDAVDVRLRNVLTGETKEFSTDMTVADLDAMVAKDQEIGITSIE